MGGNFINSMPARVTRFRAWFGNLNSLGKLFVGCWLVTIFLCALPYMALTGFYQFFTIDNSESVAIAPTATSIPPTKTFTPTISPTATEIPFSSLVYEGGECASSNLSFEEAVVVDVIDGDTIVVEMAGEQIQVRYIGMDTPEKNQQYGDRALTANRSLVQGNIVFMVKDESEVDSFDRLLRYVFTENTFVNYQLVNLGYAEAASYPRSLKRRGNVLLLAPNPIIISIEPKRIRLEDLDWAIYVIGAIS